MSTEQNNNNKEIQKCLEKLLKEQKAQSKSLARLETAVMGDPEAGNEGVIKRVKIVEEKTEKQGKQLAKYGTVIAVVLTMLTAFKEKVIYLLKAMF